MSTTAFAGSVLADTLPRSRSLVTSGLLVSAGVVLVAVSAQVSIPLWPVPITGQTLAVLIVGAALGPLRGGLSLGLYALVGLLGLPVFADWTGGFAAVGKPSFGFIIGFIPTAILVGWLAQREWDRHVVRATALFLMASAIPFVFGLPYLAVALGALGLDNSVGTVVATGLLPFIPGGIVKAILAGLIVPAAWRGVRALDDRQVSHDH